MSKVLSAPDAPRAAPGVLPDETPERAALSEALRQVDALRDLPVGWNGYNSLPPSSASVSHALRWLEAQWRQCWSEGIRWYAPNVTASAEGEVVFEWWAHDRTLSLYCTEDADDRSKGCTAEYLKFGRRGGGLADLREQGAADTAEAAAALMLWFGE